jgi:site-specific DNA recombinase
MTPSSLRVALYARVSSQQQAEANTIASQVEALKTRIHADGLRWEVEACFLDEGYSGSTLLRPALERLRDQIAAGALDRLYVHSPDRLARNYALQVLLLDEWQRAGIEVIFLNRPLGKSPEEDLLLQVQGMMAEYERAKILERSRRGKRHAARAGSINVLCGAPYGYRYVGKHEGGGQARYEIHEEQARVVRQIFAWVGLERCSIGEVCRRLQTQQIPSPKGKPYWDRTTVWGILKNPAYKGQAQFGKTHVGPRRPRYDRYEEKRRSRVAPSASMTLQKLIASPSRFPPWLRRSCSRPWPSSFRRIGDGAARVVGAPAICSKACWCVEAVAIPTTASRSADQRGKGRHAIMPTTAV